MLSPQIVRSLFPNHSSTTKNQQQHQNELHFSSRKLDSALLSLPKDHGDPPHIKREIHAHQTPEAQALSRGITQTPNHQNTSLATIIGYTCTKVHPLKI
jgi:hypothetical protein